VLPRRDLNARYGGGWALITGASDGIGKQYAFELAKLGFNILLMARDSQKLQAVAKEIHQRFQGKIKTRLIVYDFTNLASLQSLSELEALLERELKEVEDVSILVNNVGCCKSVFLDRHRAEEAMRQVNVNLNSQVYMTRLVLPRLLTR